MNDAANSYEAIKNDNNDEVELDKQLVLFQRMIQDVLLYAYQKYGEYDPYLLEGDNLNVLLQFMWTGTVMRSEEQTVDCIEEICELGNKILEYGEKSTSDIEQTIFEMFIPENLKKLMGSEKEKQ